MKATCRTHSPVLLLDRLKPGDVLVLDRGYPSFEILCILQDAGIDFVIRAPASNTFGAVEELLISGNKDAVITIDPSDKGAMKDHAPIQVRALRVKPPGGDWRVIVTSLQKWCQSRQVSLGRAWARRAPGRDGARRLGCSADRRGAPA